MSIKIEITAHPESGDMATQLKDAFAALGYFKYPARPWLQTTGEMTFAYEPRHKTAVETPDAAAASTQERVAEVLAEAEKAAVEEPKRERGQPSGGRSRRTKAEIAEDEAATQPTTSPVDVLAISTGEERIDPEVVAQDAVDEAAEVAATKTKLTRDDLRQAVGAYSKVHGIVAAQKNIPLILGCSIMELPDTQEDLSAAIAKVVAATFTVDATTSKPEAPQATKADVVESFKAYMAKYPGKLDGVDFVQLDGKALLRGVFGEEIDRINLIPDEPAAYGKALAAINAAISADPFKRGGK